MSEPKIGPTGEYGQGGPLHSGDRGGLNVRLSAINNMIVMDFGTALNWLGLTPETAMPVCKRLGKMAIEVSGGNIDYNQLGIGTFTDMGFDTQIANGVRVETNIEQQLIEVIIPCDVTQLVFDAQGAFNFAVMLMKATQTLRPDLKLI